MSRSKKNFFLGEEMVKYLGILREKAQNFFFFGEELKVELLKSSEKQAFSKPQGKIHAVIIGDQPKIYSAYKTNYPIL